MNTKWRIRPYERWAFVQDVQHPHPRAGIIDADDNVILYLADDDSEEDVCVRVEPPVSPGARMIGVISRTNQMGSRGDSTLAGGISVEFEEKHVFRLEKAT